MASPIEITRSQNLSSQVGGHAGVQTTEDGSLLIKPALSHELDFYQSLQQDPYLASLRPYTPKFIGTLKLEGSVDPNKPTEAAGLLSIVLENISHTFKLPNILDIKLGTVLYDDGAPPEKVARMIQTAKDTTSFETGVRLTGFQVHDNRTKLAVNTPKSYGKTIKASQLGEGIAKFFPVGDSTLEDGTASPSGLPRETLIHVLGGIRDEVAEIREVFSTLELRMVGGSILIVYEADWERADEGIKKFGRVSGESAPAEAADGEEEEESDDDDDESKSKVGMPFAVKLIDFAHTKLFPGQGKDEGVLTGFDTVLRLLDARLEEISQD